MTELLYLSDTYTFDGIAIIIETGANESGSYIILDQTIFYPQGGGQPSDTGMITDGESIFEVKMVRLDEAGIVYHYGELRGESFEIGESVSLEVQKERRILNAQNHSAGHLLDIALKNIGLGYMKPTKGYHFTEGPYVEYTGNLREPIESILPKLQNEVDILIKKDIRMIIKYDTSAKSPEGKTPRYTYFDGYEGCGCGGTHVRNTGEIGKMIIRKIKSKNNTIKVSYSVG